MKGTIRKFRLHGFVMTASALLVSWLSPSYALADDCAGKPYACAKNVPYAKEFLVTDLRQDWVDHPNENPGDCSRDDFDHYALVQSYNVHNMDIYYPRNHKTKRKVIFFIHGGGWMDNYKERYEYVANVFTGEKGWVTVVINFRSTSDKVFKASTCPTKAACVGRKKPNGWAKSGSRYTKDSKSAWFPDNLNDVADAMRWVLANIANSPYKGDPNNIFILGHSSGAHLGTLLAVRPDFGMQKKIAGVISMSGVFSLKDMPWKTYGWYLDHLFKGCGHHNEPPCSGAVLAKASPITYIKPSNPVPPMLIMYAQGELPGFDQQSKSFSRAMTNATQRADLVFLSAFDHSTEIEALAYNSSNEPKVTAQGSKAKECLWQFGPNPKPAGYVNPTDRIVRWVESRAR